MKYQIAAVVCLLVANAVVIARADDADKPNVTVETVYTGLHHPCGVAVQPTTGNVYVSESGAGQVVRFSPTELGKPSAAVTGFPLSNSGNALTQNTGPLGLAFLHQNLIVVGGSQQKDGEDVIRVYALAAGPNQAALDFKSAKGTLKRVVIGEEKPSGPASYWGLAMSPSALWVTSQGEQENDWIFKASIGGDSFENLAPFLRTTSGAHLDGPMGIAVRNSREFLVASFAGKLDAAEDSTLAFYHIRRGNMMMTLQTGLHDLVALAYSPSSNRLYAVDLAWSAAGEGGIYRLDAAKIDGRSGVKAVKIASLERPTALAFTADNTLYAVALGESEKDGDESGKDAPRKGVLVKITGDL
jgi:DNA-binding beta-propeller fold protein YncE